MSDLDEKFEEKVRNEGLGEEEELEEEGVGEEVVGEVGEEAEEESPSFDVSKLPEDLQDKSPEEIGALWSQMMTTGQTLAGQMKQMQQQQQQQQMQQQQVEAPEFTQEDFVDDPSGFTEKLNQFFESKAAPFVNDIQATRAQSTYMQAMQHYPLLREYKGQVDQMMANATPDQMANPQTWAYVNAEIMNNNVDDIIRKREEYKKKPPPPDVHKSGKGGEGSRGKSKKLSRNEKFIADQLGISYDNYAKMRE